MACGCFEVRNELCCIFDLRICWSLFRRNLRGQLSDDLARIVFGYADESSLYWTHHLIDDGYISFQRSVYCDQIYATMRTPGRSFYPPIGLVHGLIARGDNSVVLYDRAGKVINNVLTEAHRRYRIVCPVINAEHLLLMVSANFDNLPNRTVVDIVNVSNSMICNVFFDEPSTNIKHISGQMDTCRGQVNINVSFVDDDGTIHFHLIGHSPVSPSIRENSVVIPPLVYKSQGYRRCPVDSEWTRFRLMSSLTQMIAWQGDLVRIHSFSNCQTHQTYRMCHNGFPIWRKHRSPLLTKYAIIWMVKAIGEPWSSADYAWCCMPLNSDQYILSERCPGPMAPKVLLVTAELDSFIVEIWDHKIHIRSTKTLQTVFHTLINSTI